MEALKPAHPPAWVFIQSQKPLTQGSVTSRVLGRRVDSQPTGWTGVVSRVGRMLSKQPPGSTVLAWLDRDIGAWQLPDSSPTPGHARPRQWGGVKVSHRSCLPGSSQNGPWGTVGCQFPVPGSTDVPDSSLEQTRRPSCRRWCSKQIMSVGHYGKGPWGQGFTSQVSQLGWVL